MDLSYLGMLLHPFLEIHEDLTTEGVAPTLLFPWTALQDRQQGLQRLRQL